MDSRQGFNMKRFKSSNGVVRIMARKCGTCGEAGHDSRNCDENDSNNEWKEIQKTLKKPKFIHISDNRSIYRCGASKEWWPEKYMSDEFAQTLPTCPNCLEATEAKQ